MSDVLLLDNLDSFTYNLVDSLQSFHQRVLVYRNTVALHVLTDAIANMDQPVIVLSPGPGIPNTAGSLLQVIELFKGKVPILGICLGHQALVQSYGGTIHPAPEMVHGKTSYITHDQKDMFASLPNPLLVARYHSLLCTTVPMPLCINAHYNTMVMGVKYYLDRVCGLQFHPESILTPMGSILLHDTLQWLRHTDQ
ncbi:aminodeoxychorismate/anthranilate synthase component II [Buchnera aphidicola]|uniref:anthranilate synthase n=1 Tax=Buchnera aphidicola (Cinara strobi) TaxID=1921549 RepID=A0A3B1E9R4_9GAMM|nr:aminodeoxychorismate/anthranilate synthase component II [Buchnera aphidicola]VAX77189.1 Anthranilate synthase component 2 [Buchnera aphidicola (Cinara strobi)]